MKNFKNIAYTALVICWVGFSVLLIASDNVNPQASFLQFLAPKVFGILLLVGGLLFTGRLNQQGVFDYLKQDDEPEI